MPQEEGRMTSNTTPRKLGIQKIEKKVGGGNQAVETGSLITITDNNNAISSTFSSRMENLLF